jgi:putative transposase
MIYPVVRELAGDDVPVATACRVLEVSTSGYYDWRDRPLSATAQADAALLVTVRQVHAASHGTYGARRVHAELRLGHGRMVARKRIERLMREHGVAGVHRRRLRGCTRRDEAATPSEDRVERAFTADRPDRLWVADVTQHRTGEGWVYLAAVQDVFSRRIVGWAIADHMRTELVVDALQMAIWRRGGNTTGTIHHSDHGSTYTSWLFGTRLRQAGLLGSMGSIGDCFDNAMAESFFATLQTELLDRRAWATRQELANALVAYIEAFYNPRRRHSALGYLSPVDYETAHRASLTLAA